MSQFRRKLLESYATNKLVYPGLIAAWSAKGKTNEDVDRNVLKDLTGNGHDITLNNFAYSGMSGYGGYVLSIPELEQNGGHVIHNNYMKFKIISSPNPLNGLIYRWHGQNKRNAFKLKVKYNDTNCRLYFGKAANISDNKITSVLLKEGINEIPYFTWNESEDNWEGIMVTDNNNSALPVDTLLDVDVEFIPEYPDALVFDGVDDYGYNKTINHALGDNPDYTIIVDRTWIQHKSPSSLISIANFSNSQFLFEHINGLGTSTFSRGIVNYVNYPKKISWQIFNSYNQQPIKYGNNSVQAIDMYLGCLESKQQYSKVAFYSAYLFDRSLDEQEIKSFIRKHIDPEYLLPSEIPTPPPQQGELKYWLCGEDAPVNNKWIDRIDNRMKWELVGSSIYNQEDKYYEFGELIKKQAVFNDTNNIFNCGDKFEIEIDFECLPVPDNVPNKVFLLDIGSVTATDKNFGIAIKENKIITNYKMFGDATNDKYGIDSPQLNNTTIIKEGRQSIYFGVEKFSDTQNIVYVKDSFGNKVYAPNPHTPINHSNFNIKQYFIGAGFTPGYSFNTVKIYNIKVYVKSYKETMNFIIIPLADAAEVFTNDELEAARKSIDGKEVIVHEEILLQKKVERGLMTLPTDSEPVVWTYPVYAYNSKELDTLLDSDKWTSKEEIMTVASDNTIEFIPPMKIEEGNIYREDGITYKCIQTSRLPISNKLKDLVNYYVEIVK